MLFRDRHLYEKFSFGIAITRQIPVSGSLSLYKTMFRDHQQSLKSPFIISISLQNPLSPSLSVCKILFQACHLSVKSYFQIAFALQNSVSGLLSDYKKCSFGIAITYNVRFCLILSIVWYLFHNRALLVL